jgi:plasmid stabilization system protein ParE
MRQLRYTQSAWDDLLDAWLFIAEENPLAADHVLDTIEREANALLLQPLMGRARPELAEGLRYWPTATAYILFYLAGDDEVTIIRVLHHARDLQRIGF